jgi:hypothetical protein
LGVQKIIHSCTHIHSFIEQTTHSKSSCQDKIFHNNKINHKQASLALHHNSDNNKQFEHHNKLTKKPMNAGYSSPAQSRKLIAPYRVSHFSLTTKPRWPPTPKISRLFFSLDRPCNNIQTTKSVFSVNKRQDKDMLL